MDRSTESVLASRTKIFGGEASPVVARQAAQPRWDGVTISASGRFPRIQRLSGKTLDRVDAQPSSTTSTSPSTVARNGPVLRSSTRVVGIDRKSTRLTPVTNAHLV